jgi:hypothetical protein
MQFWRIHDLLSPEAPKVPTSLTFRIKSNKRPLQPIDPGAPCCAEPPYLRM